MTARPIIFSAPMIRALLDGQKTQTRRIVKPQPPRDHSPLVVGRFCPTVIDRWGEELPGEEVFGVTTESGEWCLPCPYGQPGDLLWVKETFQPILTPYFDPPDSEWATGKGYQVLYMATDKAVVYVDRDDNVTERRKPSTHMPRWASRLTLRITDVRVQRVQEISEADAEAEGGSPYAPIYGDTGGYSRRELELYKQGFKQLWQSIHGPDSWSANLYVWALTFEVIRKNIAEVNT